MKADILKSVIDVLLSRFPTSEMLLTGLGKERAQCAFLSLGLKLTNLSDFAAELRRTSFDPFLSELLLQSLCHCLLNEHDSFLNGVQDLLISLELVSSVHNDSDWIAASNARIVACLLSRGMKLDYLPIDLDSKTRGEQEVELKMICLALYYKNQSVPPRAIKWLESQNFNSIEILCFLLSSVKGLEFFGSEVKKCWKKFPVQPLLFTIAAIVNNWNWIVSLNLIPGERNNLAIALTCAAFPERVCLQKICEEKLQTKNSMFLSDDENLEICCLILATPRISANLISILFALRNDSEFSHFPFIAFFTVHPIYPGLNLLADKCLTEWGHKVVDVLLGYYTELIVSDLCDCPPSTELVITCLVQLQSSVERSKLNSLNIGVEYLSALLSSQQSRDRIADNCWPMIWRLLHTIETDNQILKNDLMDLVERHCVNAGLSWIQESTHHLEYIVNSDRLIDIFNQLEV